MVVYPPIAKAEVDVPGLVLPATNTLPVAISLTSVHAVPFHASVFVLFAGSLPPKNTADVLSDPLAEPSVLAVLIFAISVQLVPSHDSTLTVLGGPPEIAKPEVDVPVPAKDVLVSFKLFTSVQLDPFQSSLFAVCDPGPSPPPAPKAAVVVPAPAKLFLPSFKSFTSVHADPFQVSVVAK